MPSNLVRLRRGEFTVSGGTQSVQKSLTGDLGFTSQVDITKTIDLCMAMSSDDEPERAMFCHQMLDGDTLEVARYDAASGGPDVTIGWQIAECDGDMTVTRLTHNWGGGTGRNISIPSGVTVGDSWIFNSHYRFGTGFNNNDWLMTRFNDQTSGEWDDIRCEFQSNATSGSAQVEARFVTWPDCEVREYRNVLVQGFVDTAVSPAVSDLTKAGVVSTNNTETGSNARWDRGAGHTRLTSTSNIRASTNFSSDPGDGAEFTHQLIEFSDGSVVEKIPINFGTGDSQLDENITVDLTRSLAWLNGGQGTGYNQCETDRNTGNLDRHTVLISDPGGGQVRVRRLTTGSVAEGTLHLWQIPVIAPSGFQPYWRQGGRRVSP